MPIPNDKRAEWYGNPEIKKIKVTVLDDPLGMNRDK